MDIIVKFITLFIVCILFMKTVYLAENEKLHTKRLGECFRCKLLTDSYKNWLDKTSRGKHDGGDAAWEETKLKSYSRSEMRLVEIQENLCSELKAHQDHCYALAEEAEQIIEEFWFLENHNSADIYQWLCIEKLEYCCPLDHFGETCTPCARDENNKICAGNGKCNGNGTRKGNGTCICHKGYSGTNCDVCAFNFYSDRNLCKPCHQSCDQCIANGPEYCVKCTAGWDMQSDVCVDINECLDLGICKLHEFCVNRLGSYDCKTCDKTCKTCLGPGPKNCTSCNPIHTLLFGVCLNNDLVKNIVTRITSYSVLLLMTIFIFKKSRKLASLIILTFSLVLYYFEKSSEQNLMDIISAILKTL